MAVSLAKSTFHGVHKDDKTKRTTVYATPKNVFKFGLRKDNMPPGQYDVIETTHDGAESIVLTAYKTA